MNITTIIRSENTDPEFHIIKRRNISALNIGAMTAS